jgi:hypothetical protein
VRLVAVSDHVATEQTCWHVQDYCGEDCGSAVSRMDAVRLMSRVAMSRAGSLPLLVLHPDGSPSGDRLG